MMNMFDDLGRIGEEAVIALYFNGMTEENTGPPEPGESGAFRTQARLGTAVVTRSITCLRAIL
jgi:hypothetical protein